MSLRLYDWGPSPFCLKVRYVLDYKGLPYRRTNVLGKGLIDVWRRGRIGKVPALEIDGELVCDSTDICHALERRAPDPPILPEGARDRGLCHALEEWADEALYWIGIYYQWWEPGGRAMVPAAFGRGPFGRAAFTVYERRLHRQLKGQGTGRKPESHVAADLERNLDAAVDLLADSPYLLGDHPYLCDFAVASQLVYLTRPPVSKAAVARRPVLGDYLERMKSHRRVKD